MSVRQGPPTWFDEIPPPGADRDAEPPPKPNGTDHDPPREKSIWIEAGGWVEQDVPKRPWLAPGYLLRASLTLIAGPGSSGKSMLMVGWAIAAALDRPFHNFRPLSSLRTLIYNVEDDADEQARRFSATLRQFGATPADLADKVIRAGPRHAGTMIHFNPATNTYTPTEVMQDLEDAIREHRPDQVFLDPLVELHNAPENDNTALRMIAAILRDLAVRYNVAIAIADHARKGSADAAGDPDSIRGASSKVGAVRIALTVITMSEADAATFSIDKENRRAYFRLDGAKQNYAPITEAEWFERQQYELDNGEQVAAAVPWFPPTDAVDDYKRTAFRDEIAKGINGVPFSPRISDKEPRSVIHLFRRLEIATPASHRNLLRELLADGFTEELFKSKQRKKATGIRTPDGMPDAEWLDRT